MTIIQIEPLESGQHPIQSQSHRRACWVAVSYTHLDVYKRQSLNFRSLTNEVEAGQEV